MIVSSIVSSVNAIRRFSLDFGQNADVKMETEVRGLKQELYRTQEALKAATKRCRDLVRELDNRTAGHESERLLRDQQLSRILRALLVLESRLKQEQKSIRQLLCEKDNVIRNQQLEIAQLRRYTKNYIKGKQYDLNLCASDDATSSERGTEKSSLDGSSSLSKDIQHLKCEIITKLNNVVAVDDVGNRGRTGIQKVYSFAESDVSKVSLTSSENTDASIITTTTEGSPSLLSTEGFCEGESTDVSPGSTLNKSNRYTPTTVTDSENEITAMVLGDRDNEHDIESDGGTGKRRMGVVLQRTPLDAFIRNENGEFEKITKITRTDSKDDGMDCNFMSEDEEQEPIYANTNANEGSDENLRDVQPSKTCHEDSSNNNNNNNDNNNAPKPEEQSIEDTSGNWYSDQDEDRLNDDVFRHSSYRPNSNHNSVLECVNQILLRDMEEEENVLSIPRRFKHRGRIVRFQPARLSDIESVGSEMERRNSDESGTTQGTEKEESPTNGTSFEATASEDEFGMKIVEDDAEASPVEENGVEDDAEEPKAIPIVIIEPKDVVEVEESSSLGGSTSTSTLKFKSPSPILRLERMEEKTCLQMSTKGLTIAKNLDYEDIESLPEILSSPPVPKTPPALPPKPQFRNNTLILKKIPSPSFLIDETKRKDCPKKGFAFSSSSSSPLKGVKSLTFDESPSKVAEESGSFWKNRFNNVRSSFQARQGDCQGEQTKKGITRVTNIVKHFEEFKIGGEHETDRLKDRGKRDKHVVEFEQDFDIRQNFEEFKLDECDLSDDPNRAEADGSERIGCNAANLLGNSHNETSMKGVKENNNVLTNDANSGYDYFLEATGLSNKSILTPSRLLSNHKSMLKPKDVKYKNKIKATAVLEKHGMNSANASQTHVKHWTGPFV